MHPRERDILSPDEILQLTALEQGHKLCKREAAFYGFCAGVLACTASTPIRHAAFGASSLFRIPAFVRDTARSSGILSLWRGNSTACVMIAPKCAVRYAVYNSVMSYLTDEENPTTLHRVIAGTLASTTAELAAFPFNVIRHRQRPAGGRGLPRRARRPRAARLWGADVHPAPRRPGLLDRPVGRDLPRPL